MKLDNTVFLSIRTFAKGSREAGSRSRTIVFSGPASTCDISKKTDCSTILDRSFGLFLKLSGHSFRQNSVYDSKKRYRDDRSGIIGFIGF